ncbi:nitrate regulatory protein [Marinomonas mediterranea]|jgi:Response regulator with putative antiterminator output domain|uniref:ANTAR domain-containing protein n=1 Tax=Marinomonas mediterranea (strain ATCC 700492 / JCM 21426 / NBRC 103028 / MMB-1) TaxID=717774 RepID=F2JZZ0_MARM1|nr:nitrate regulatory protein [Marinomonas mediterranea]ADZ92102.1 ANTAR domain protein with unknown sensor [Marinomonas mediterranea MMB-1]WCN10063.1 ANTAR domain-containing protein [Marinomonas mediterranea]WCN14114.1 ANTAR domain-containing protein [Marinomonas mediterranea]WCN18169.1 ANTAR domain-containing protein [Marinomonas mediterranea MMB-1]
MKTQPNTENFLLAAKQSEINALKRLMLSSKLVIRVTELIHELQKERGLSNSFLVSEGNRFAKERTAELKITQAALDQFIEALEWLDLKNCGSSTIRLYSSIAFVLHQLDDLPQFRAQLSQQKVKASENTKFFNHLIAGLLSVIFEAADISNDPDITRALVALFNFVQGKEYAGQERAWGVIGFTVGEFNSPTRDQIHALQEAQQRCFSISCDFSTAIPNALWRQLEEDEATAELGKMRQLITRFQSGNSVPTSISEVWYQAATVRIDGMQTIVKQMTEELLKLSQDKITLAEEELRLHKEQLVKLANYEEPPMSPLTAMDENKTNTTVSISQGVNVKLAHSLYDLVQRQATHLQKVSEELSAAKQTLNERKQIEKAKGILMSTQKVDEEQAYKQLRQAAMDGNKRIIDIAENIISVASMLTNKP